MPNRNLKAERSRLGLTQKDVADQLGIAVPTYSKKENGKQDFTQKEMLELCKILNRTLDELFYDFELNTRVKQGGK